ncbi:ABC transporter ATP-binding protein [Sphingobacterium sp. UT-1RO-CII-1]|uniref:ABC transporter ATP-binding protein n=1 Tax=Sphingobacterium sp. UT-1RO-CII-1 TaxID=2995225 RepID=UPI00227AD131|nr:ABC transporter ATP-binding protein [Sphingobacterium sp. UT-1RO-CII-1]MCY4780246.1 ABC transporter ATP-binding protein [Sphingobacterium sp. UT-1RO-CII-1]
MSIIVSLREVNKVYQTGDTSIVALDSTSLDIYSNKLTLIVGPSGSGKTTLISLIGCVVYPTSGRIFIDGQEVTGLNEKQLALVRLDKVGFVFQHFNLLQPLTALENVMQPLLLKGDDAKQAKLRAEDVLKRVNMLDRKQMLPRKLSGGQKQRVAIARALVTDAPILLCDEPTASLDAKSAGIIMSDLKVLSQEGKAVIVVTHDLRLKQYADEIIYVEEGKVSCSSNSEVLNK